MTTPAPNLIAAVVLSYALAGIIVLMVCTPLAFSGRFTPTASQLFRWTGWIAVCIVLAELVAVSL